MRYEIYIIIIKQIIGPLCSFPSVNLSLNLAQSGCEARSNDGHEKLFMSTVHSPDRPMLAIL